jgi:hypothetical protein
MNTKGNCRKCGLVVDLETDRYVVTYTFGGGEESFRHEACDMLERTEAYEKTGYISTWLMNEADYARFDESSDKRMGLEPKPVNLALRWVGGELDRVREVVQEFEEKVWLKPWVGGGESLMATVVMTPSQISVTHDGLDIMTQCTGGRVMVTITRGNSGPFVSLLTMDEIYEKPRMTIQGIGATAEGAMSLLYAAISAWKSGARPGPGNASLI